MHVRQSTGFIYDGYVFTDQSEKLDRWPRVAADIDSNYREKSEWHSDVLEHFWQKFEVPYQFKIYIRREPH